MKKSALALLAASLVAFGAPAYAVGANGQVLEFALAWEALTDVLARRAPLRESL